MLKLVLKLQDKVIEEYNLEKTLVTVGRSKENDIVIDNVAVSRKHAQFELQEGKGYAVRDLQSSNGTSLNGAKIDGGDKEVKEGDVVGVAKFEILVKEVTSGTRAPAQPPGPEDAEGTMIIDAGRRKPGAAREEIHPPKVVHWPVLQGMRGAGEGKEFKISKEATTIGNGSPNDIPVSGWFVSSPQAKITRREDRFYISHVGSFFSSTRVNGIGIKEDHILKNKDKIQVGDSTFLFIQFLKDPPA